MLFKKEKRPFWLMYKTENGWHSIALFCTLGQMYHDMYHETGTTRRQLNKMLRAKTMKMEIVEREIKI